jgi:hypothetical protein
MIRFSRLSSFLLLAFLCCPLHKRLNCAELTSTWVNPLPGTSEMLKPLANNQVFEVAKSKFRAAKAALRDKPFVPLTEDDIGYFGSPTFQCRLPNRPYLIRAIYTNGGTGRFLVETFDRSVLVTHGSLGKRNPLEETALVVCLGFEPVHVYGQTEGAE